MVASNSRCDVCLLRVERALFVFLNPSIDVRRDNHAPYRLMEDQRAGCDLHSLGKLRLRKLLGLALRRE